MIRETEVDGVPTLIAPTSGPMNAGLVFRVGRTDEALPIAGITHLVEHLALHRHGVAEYHYNGATSAVFTSFHMQGSEQDVVKYLKGVCESLADLPMHRLETEKAILKTEAAGRHNGANQQMPLWRYGAQGHGLVSYPEWGLSRLSPAEVDHWVKTWFTRQNAVLWIAGANVPAGLELKLGDGARMPLAAPISMLPQAPAYFADEDGKVVMDAIVRRSTAAQVFTGVLERELFRSLRQESGYSYTAAANYDPRGDGYATITAVADALPDKHDAVVGGFIDVLAKLRAGHIDPLDIEFMQSKAEEGLSHPEVHASRVMSMAINVLTGQPTLTVDELRDELKAVTVADVHQVVHEAHGTTLLQVPNCHSADWAGFAQAPVRSESAVVGTSHVAFGHKNVQIVVGPEGVSLISPSGLATVRFTDCAIQLAWPDGARRLLGNDGFTIHIEPTLYVDGAALVAAIDAAMPQSKVVWQPARNPQQIPQPDPDAVHRAKLTKAWAAQFIIATLVTVFGVFGFVNTEGARMMAFLLWTTIGLGWMFWLAVKVARPRRN